MHCADVFSIGAGFMQSCKRTRVPERQRRYASKSLSACQATTPGGGMLHSVQSCSSEREEPSSALPRVPMTTLSGSPGKELMLSTHLFDGMSRRLATRITRGEKTATENLLTRFSCCGSKAEGPLCKICTHKMFFSRLHDHPAIQRLNHLWVIVMGGVRQETYLMQRLQAPETHFSVMTSGEPCQA